MPSNFYGHTERVLPSVLCFNRGALWSSPSIGKRAVISTEGREFKSTVLLLLMIFLSLKVIKIAMVSAEKPLIIWSGAK